MESKMSDLKFTKGDWKVKGSSISMGASYRGKFTIESNDFAGNISDANIANASLIKASPKMYMALQSILDSPYTELKEEDFEMIEKVLAEARGEI
ncbi:coil containing protein [Pseudoalteromonas phage HS1]|uniref:coil containing protein n=1 Tax=Pseudoalteromonas phage HS1 TaxID=1357707 RepID=UPI0023292492|nr:coil containing protein [Pseudoalteromonas phage HS1]